MGPMCEFCLYETEDGSCANDNASFDEYGNCESYADEDLYNMGRADAVKELVAEINDALPKWAKYLADFRNENGIVGFIADGIENIADKVKERKHGRHNDV